MTVVLLFTKQYPFGRLETYLNNEIGILSKNFDKVIIIPVDEYKFESLNPMIATLGNVEVIRVNAQLRTQSFSEKLLAQLHCFQILLKEVFFGNEGRKHLSKFRFCLTYLKVCRRQADHLYEILSKEQSEGTRFIFYSYWLTKTTITATFLHRLFKKKIQNISRAHSSDLYHKYWNDYIRLDNPPFMPFEYFKVKNSDHVYTISDHGCNHFRKIFPAWQQKFSVARLGVTWPKRSGSTPSPVR